MVIVLLKEDGLAKAKKFPVWRTLTVAGEKVDFVLVTPKMFGFRDGASRERFFSEAEKQNLRHCPRYADNAISDLGYELPLGVTRLLVEAGPNMRPVFCPVIMRNVRPMFGSNQERDPGYCTANERWVFALTPENN